MKKQPHLPEILSDYAIGGFLRINKYSIEIAKKKIDMYFTIRSKMPHIFELTNPTKPEMMKYANDCYFIPLPKLTKQHRRISIFKPTNNNPDLFDPLKSFAWSLAICELRVLEDFESGDIFIADLGNCGLGHLTKTTPMLMKQSNSILEKVYTTRVAEIHFINCPTIVDRFLIIFKSVVSPKIAQRIHVHEKLEDMHKVISPEDLPADYGGKQPPLKEINEKLKACLMQRKAHYDHLDTLKVNENLRIEPFNDDILGFHGNFKKLTVD